MELIKNRDISEQELKLFCKCKYISIDTETTGLDFLNDKLCTIQLLCEEYAALIKYNPNIEYIKLKELLLNSEIIKIFHNAVFDVSFLMKNLNLQNFESIVCTKISSKLVNGLKHNNSLKFLIKEYLNVDISKEMQLSDWSSDVFTENQIEYAMNDVKYLYNLWCRLKEELNNKELYSIAEDTFKYIPSYIKLKRMGVDNIFVY